MHDVCVYEINISYLLHKMAARHQQAMRTQKSRNSFNGRILWKTIYCIDLYTVIALCAM